MSVALGFVQDLTQSETCVVVTCRRLPDCKEALPLQTRAKSVPSMIAVKCEEEVLAKLKPGK
jgi:hypothetical protein